MRNPFCIFILTLFLAVHAANAGPASKTVRETAEWIVKKFGTGRAGKTIDEVAAATARAVEKHGDEALPLLRSAGHAGFEALETAGKQAPDVLKLFARRGDEAVWLISQPKKLAIFMKHGDTAADALLKHPGIADDLIERLGREVVGPLQQLGKSGAQQMGMAASEGVFSATSRSGELIGVIGKYGDRAMDFIWRHKGALAITATLTAFLANPEPFIQGGKELITEPVNALGAAIIPRANWTILLSVTAAAAAALCAFRMVLRSRRQPR
jgi:hypothetical protein